MKEKKGLDYRVVQTRNQDISNPWHSDWNKPPEIDLSRVQAVLFLSEEGKDYSGSGFTFVTNNE